MTAPGRAPVAASARGPVAASGRTAAAGPGGTRGPVLLACDLDRTLIYSAAALALTTPDAEAPRLLCVEVYEGRPLSYMTETAARLMARLTRPAAEASGPDGSGPDDPVRGDPVPGEPGPIPQAPGQGEPGTAQALLVPSTTRTREQYQRLRLPGGTPPYALCANGGHLLVDGVPDPDWHALVRRRLADCAPLAEITDHLHRTAGTADWLLKERTADDLFAYLVVDRERLPDGWLKELTEWAGPRGWTVSLQGRKVYAVPRTLTKSAAVAEIARRTGATTGYAAGDSLLDADLLLAADGGWHPAHGELADTGWSAPHITALPERGIAAGERILHEMTTLVRTLS